jgi:hypothetical protein
VVLLLAIRPFSPPSGRRISLDPGRDPRVTSQDRAASANQRVRLIGRREGSGRRSPNRRHRR